MLFPCLNCNTAVNTEVRITLQGSVSFSSDKYQKVVLLDHMCVLCVSCSVVSDSATSWTIACQAPLSMEFSRQEYWIGLPFPFPFSGNLPDPGIETGSPALLEDSLTSEPQGNCEKGY